MILGNSHIKRVGQTRGKLGKQQPRASSALKSGTDLEPYKEPCSHSKEITFLNSGAGEALRSLRGQSSRAPSGYSSWREGRVCVKVC